MVVWRLQHLIEAKGGFNGYTPLKWACMNGHVEIATSLLDREALVNETNNNDDTALHYAARSDNMDLCELLISRGADPMAVNKRNHTPLDMIGLYRDDNDPDDPNEERPPLTAAEKKERHDRLLEVFGEYLE